MILSTASSDQHRQAGPTAATPRQNNMETRAASVASAASAAIDTGDASYVSGTYGAGKDSRAYVLTTLTCSLTRSANVLTPAARDEQSSVDTPSADTPFVDNIDTPLVTA